LGAGLLLLPLCAANAACQNEAVRTGFSAVLPNCRAYELVTPPDSNGRLLETLSTFGFNSTPDLFPTELGSASGKSFIYMTYNTPLRNFAEPTGTLDIVEAARLEGGWQTYRRLSPSGEQAVLPVPGGVSADHRYTFTNVSPFEGKASPKAGGSLAAEGEADYLGKPDGSFEPTAVGSLGGERLAQGRYISPDGSHVIFTTGKRLEPAAPPTGTLAVYDRTPDGTTTKVVSLLPGDVTPVAAESAAFQGVSADGSTVAFKIKGTLYARVPDAEDGDTLKVVEGDPTFAGLSADGRYLFYVAGGNIHRFDTGTKADDQLNSTGDAQISNVSSDGSHIYFISESQIGGQGAAGQPNLFVWSDASQKFIATVLPSDLEHTSGDLVGRPALGNWSDWVVTPNRSEPFGVGPGAESSRTTPDGTVFIFESRAKLTAYENAGHTEIYRYDEAIPDVVCVSCGAEDVAPAGDARLQAAGSKLVNPPMVLHNLSEDGRRVFFESPDPLVAEDVDGVNDIYEWQKEELGGRELHLISSGQSTDYPLLFSEAFWVPSPNVLLAISPSGDDVFFLTQDPLVVGAGTGGANAIYDARVGGGFPLAPPPHPCSEEGCRPTSSPAPNLGSVPSVDTAGGGNVKPRAKPRRPRCRHSKQRQHGACGKRGGTMRPQPRRAVASTATAYGADAPPASLQGSQTEPSPASPDNGPGPQAPSPVASGVGEGEFAEFGISSVGAGLSLTGAGRHPDFPIAIVLNHHTDKNGLPQSDARVKDVVVSLPPGLIGNPTAVPRCSSGEFLAFGHCGVDAQVGVAEVLVSSLGPVTEPIYNLEPPHPDKEVARFGFYGGLYPVYIDITVRTAGDFGVTAIVHNSPGQGSLLEAHTTLWGNPADPIHDPKRVLVSEASKCGGTGIACEAPEGKRSSGLPPTAFVSNPSTCQQGEVAFGVTSYQLPGQVFSANAPLPSITDCQGLPFAPVFEAQPTNHVAGAPTGLRTKLVLPQSTDPSALSTATMREARVTLPRGMQIAAGAANWVGTCSEGQVGFHEEVDANCPDASKLGTAAIKSPALMEPLHGFLYQRTPTPGHQLGLWLVTDELGLHVKLPGELEPDPNTGRLTAVFRALPQVPVEEIDLNVWGGPRAPLQNPDHCGAYTTSYSFLPHSNDPVVSGQTQLTISEGCNQGFDPRLSAGVTNPVAGRFSPLIVDLSREDGQQALRGLELKLPDGELAKIKGVPLCSDGGASSGNCPASSKLGQITAAAGPGSDPLWVPQPGRSQPSVYLAGSYQGSPFSIVSVVPAQAGPFDLGNVVVRSGLELDPNTNRALVKADPLPQFFEGVGLTYRRLHVVVDRPEFSLNPTDCREMQVNSTVTSTQGTVAHPASRFQVDGCKSLKFKPRLSLKLSGGTKRADYPALTAILKARKGDANIARASVALPHSEFLAQEHIVTVCTRKQFAAAKCPKGAIYGKAKAWTPLLAKPLSGPVYLRSSDHPLPDVVAALGGELDVTLVGRIDSRHGGIRTTFASIPDAPVSKFILKMRGGAKSLLTNSTDICHGHHQATVGMWAQNGRVLSSRPLLEGAGCE
jgi:hypothetical protein